MRVAVIGVGYVGLTTAACLAHLGHEVIAADVVEDKVNALNDGRIPIVEEGLEDLVQTGLEKGLLRFVHGSDRAVPEVDFVFLCVPTPQDEDGSADLSYVEAAAATIGPHLRPETIVVNKSTVPVGSTHVVERALQRDDVFVVSNPEFLREGSAVHDFLNPDRIVVGADSATAAIKVTELFSAIRTAVVVTDPPTAETIKYASNAFLATKVSFVNAMANVCEAVGANVRDVVLGMGYDKRIGSAFLAPGPGWGGSCFPKDSQALVSIAEQAGYDFGLLRGVIDVNRAQHQRVVDRLTEMVGGSLAGQRIAAWGLTFKARTDDLRDSPALEVIKRLTDAGACVTAYDPTHPSGFESFSVAGDALSACDDAVALVVLTEWDEFRWIDLGKARARMMAHRIYDTRNVIDPLAARRAGFTFAAVGLAG